MRVKSGHTDTPSPAERDGACHRGEDRACFNVLRYPKEGDRVFSFHA